MEANETLEGQDPFEAITKAGKRHWDRGCPFRGHPFVPEFDERCPETFDVIATPVVVTSYRGMTDPQVLVHAAPRLVEDSYCWTCTHDQVREKEEGHGVSAYRYRETTPSKGKRRR